MIALLSLVPTLAILLIAGIYLWRSLVRIKHRGVRAGVRIVSVLGLVCPIGSILWMQVARPFVDGDDVCIACGQSQRRLTYFGIALWRSPTTLERSVGAASDRYAGLAGVGDHTHDWMPVGCRQNGLAAVGCTMISHASWFAELPDIEDQDLARALAVRLRAAPIRERHALLCSFDWCGPTLGVSKFDAWHEAWLRSHPDWP